MPLVDMLVAIIVSLIAFLMGFVLGRLSKEDGTEKIKRLEKENSILRIRSRVLMRDRC